MRGMAWLSGICAAGVCASVLAAPAAASPFVQTTNRYEAFGPIVTADFNEDGNIDIASMFGSSLKVVLGNGDGTFSDTVSYDTGVPVYLFRAIDVNADSKPDIVFGISSDGQGQAGEIDVMLNAGDGTFGSPTKVADANYVFDLVSADFNGDGDPDLAIATPGIQLLIGGPGASFTEGDFVNMGGAVLGEGDFNGDGDPDLVGAQNAQADAGVTIAVGSGATTATFGEPIPLGASGASQGSLAVTDVNGDGDPDLIVPHGGADMTFSTFLGSTGATFAAPVQTAVPFQMSGLVVAADLNGDHDPDLVFSRGGGNGVATFLGGTGASFAAGPDVASGNVSGLATADFNNDGYDDVAVGFGDVYDFPNDDPDQGPVPYGDLEVFTSHVPAKPSQLATTPASPAKDTSPRVTGTADDGTTVKLYANSSCTGTPVATGTAAAFADPGLTVTVANGSTTTYYATASDTFGTSKCSTSAAAYHNTAPTLNVSADTHPEPNQQVPFTVSGVAGTSSGLFYLATGTGNSCASSYTAQSSQSQGYGADTSVPAGPFSIDRQGPPGPVRMCVYLYEAGACPGPSCGGFDLGEPADAVASTVLTNGAYGDTDGDGVPNNLDACPFNAGVAAGPGFPSGCPMQGDFNYPTGGFPSGGSPSGGSSNADDGEQIADADLVYLVPGKASLKKFLKKPVLGSISCLGCTVTVTLEVPASIAKKLHLKSATIGTAKKTSLRGKLPLTFTLRLSKKLKSKLLKLHKVVVTMRTTVTYAGKKTKLAVKRTTLSK